MIKTWIQPKLVMGHLEVVGPDDEVAIPYDEAVVHLEGDEDSEIEVRCTGALASGWPQWRRLASTSCLG